MSPQDSISKDLEVENPQNIDNKSKKPQESFFRTFLWALFCAVILRSFAFEPFHIPSSSMYPNLLIGDYIFVNKFAYGYSRYSLPFGFKIFEGRIFRDSPKRGDIVVFRLPAQPSINYVKRLVGLPGDAIQVINGILYINNQEVTKTYKEEVIEKDGDKKVTFKKYIEKLPEGKEINVYDRDMSAQDNTGIYNVPAGHYFFMGDNRDDSQDSRFLNLVGYVPEENLVGRASFIFFSNQNSIFNIWEWLKTIRFNRIGNSLSYDK